MKPYFGKVMGLWNKMKETAVLELGS